MSAAEYLAFEKDMHVLVIMTDMTAYAEALREFSSSKGEIPGRKGYPGYLYSDLASLYERAGMVHGKVGTVTQLPILTMPNDDVTHPVPDLTGYITEGTDFSGSFSGRQRHLSSGGYSAFLVPFDEGRHRRRVYPGMTTRLLADQLFASYAKCQDARSLASVIGAEELSTKDKRYLEFGRLFEAKFITQGYDENPFD